ncbi:hypothetical protein BC937DRAFT_91687 [Endogone sp. FLAS-F59071]|nr:hypothetical protein BC937DRAFT_91687 [Endogone sp. FLAS-F59071]|eukprot:RUS21729.1 hypothetical protein BC937DRAFT_91687 [Endogone sp. FLAS-F59071]
MIDLHVSHYSKLSTTQMAQDTIELLEYVGWTSDVHLVGISMGGMIALETVSARPDMFKSLCLTVATAGRIMAPLSAINGVIRLAFFTSTPEDKTKAMVEMLYPRSWLDQAPESNKEFNSNREDAIHRYTMHRNQTRVQPLHGNLAQSVACMRHYVSDERLHVIRDTGVPILVITGTWDNLVDPRNSHHLAKELKSDFEVFIRSGHAIPQEKPRRYNELLLVHFRKSR